MITLGLYEHVLALRLHSWAHRMYSRFNSEQLVNQPVIWLADRTCNYTMFYTVNHMEISETINKSYVYRKRMYVHNAISGPLSTIS